MIMLNQSTMIKPKYNDKAKLCYMDTDSFALNAFTEDFFEDISNDVESWFDTSNYVRTIKDHFK